jgi:hypothetical protein
MVWFPDEQPVFERVSIMVVTNMCRAFVADLLSCGFFRGMYENKSSALLSALFSDLTESIHSFFQIRLKIPFMN